jgi:DNA repair exonuclease SbcCD nuclease subunit
VTLTVVGDPHTKNDNLEKIGAIFDKVEELGNPTVILGDLFHFKEVIRGRCLNYVFERVSQSKLKFYLLVGNHDWFNLECTEHSLELFKQLPNVVVIDKTCFDDETGIGYMPYIHGTEAWNSAFAGIVDQCPRILFMHQGVTGFDYGNGYIAENELPLSALKDVPLVISGHFHKFQAMDNLVYLGTPFSHDFGESNQEKYLGILNVETLQLDYLPTNLPSHYTIELDVDQGGLDISDAKPGDQVRVILTGSEEGIKKFDKTLFPQVRFIERPTSTGEGVNAISETDSNERKFSIWATEIKKLDPETVALGLKILEEADA